MLYILCIVLLCVILMIGAVFCFYKYIEYLTSDEKDEEE